MDAVYGCYNRHASAKICLKDYFLEYSELLKSSVCYEQNQSMEEKMFKLMGIELSKSRLDLMSHYCSINNLKTTITTTDEEGRNKHDRNLENISNTTQLETLKVLKKYDNILLHKYTTQNGTRVIYEKSHYENQVVTPSLNFLVYVQVYEPFNSRINRIGRHLQYKFPFLRIKSVISILGCQYLTDLREKIMCVSDLSIATEVSENPDQQSKFMAKDIYKSGFFFIEDTFYNDMRDPNNKDYSDVILKWAATRNRLGPFKTVKMEDVRVDTLRARFGFPWVYMHQGCCEHLIVLSDARLVTEDDDLSISNYPKIERIKPAAGKNCTMCGIHNVRWFVMEHDRVPHDTSYFCENCFKSYNYVDGKKIGNFKAFRYPYITQLMRENT